MDSHSQFSARIVRGLLAGALIALCWPAMAQDSDESDAGDVIEEIITTGTRIKNVNVVAASPVTSIGADEIAWKQTPNIERVFRDLPITIPGDGENVNNGTAGQATIDLRGLGDNRALTMVNGRRLTPYDTDGIPTTDVIPVIMLDRVDIVTGGASAVYGSDAMSGAINFILDDDFEGFEIDFGYSDFDSGAEVNGGGEDTTYVNARFGVSFDDGRGNITVGGGRTKRGAVLLGEREYGLFGVSSETGAGLGSSPPEPSPDCSGNTSLTTAHSSGVGSTTAIPATLNLRSGNSYQFRDDLTLVQGECARFNFNPFNFYQTPQDRFNVASVATYELADAVEIYADIIYSSNTSDQQVAPSGSFGQPFTIPVLNPFFTDATRQIIVDDLNAGAQNFLTSTQADIDNILALPNPTEEELDTLATLQARLAADPLGFDAVGIVDLNGDGVFDFNDSFISTARRRTLELGPRFTSYKTDYFQYVVGARGSFPANFEKWNWDVSYQRGVSDWVDSSSGYTNLTNLAVGINTVDPDECITPAGVVTPAPCTPLNIFGPVGSITDEQREAGFFTAVANEIRRSELQIWSAQVDGVVEQFKLPWAEEGLSLAVGADFMEYTASHDPDECWKLPPASCLGGAGGFRLPLSGKYESDEYFIEAIMPIVQGLDFVENLSIELGYRDADYSIQGGTESWKAGLSWEIVPGLRFRFMEQQAVRVPNIGELFSPVETGLDNATFDPCSIGNPNPPQPGSELFQRCVSTGMLPSQVGTVPDIISGQINVFNGTDQDNLPTPEEARTTTFGFVWEPAVFDWLPPTTISLDYYDIEVNNYIAEPTGQESLDLCYALGDESVCDGVVRSGGSLTESGTGTPAFFRNFVIYQAEGIDLNVTSSGYGLGRFGELGFNWIAHKYMTNEFQTTPVSPVVDCKGRYGTSCDPVPEFRSVFRVNWLWNEFDASLLWRHIGGIDIQTGEAAATFPAFRSIDSFDYYDLNLGYTFRDNIRFQLLVQNIADEDPPIVGGEVGTTSYNSGNTFPSLYDTMGRMYAANVKFSFK